jgi:hypothetical protein
MKKFKVDNVENNKYGIYLTLFDENFKIYHYKIERKELSPCKEGCNGGGWVDIYKKEIK